MQGDRGSVLYDVAAREEVGQLEGIYGPYTFSPDSRTLAVFKQKDISLWDVTQLKEVGVLKGNYGLFDIQGFGHITFTSDVKLLAVFGYHDTRRSGRIGDGKIWDLTTLQEVPSFKIPAVGGQFSPDGRLLAIQGPDNAIYLWNVARQEQVGELKGPGEPINKMVFSHDGHWLVIGSDDGTVMIWEAAPATVVEEVSADDQNAHLPQETTLLPAFPNPFNSGVSIPFVLAKDGAVRLEIYSLAGQRVRTFDLGYKSAGSYAAPGQAFWWDGRSTTGEECATGVYVSRLQAGIVAITRRLVLLK